MTTELKYNNLLKHDRMPLHLLNSLNQINNIQFLTAKEILVCKLSLIQMWLMNHHFLLVFSRSNKWPEQFDWIIEDKDKITISDVNYYSYEEALLQGISEAFKLI